MHWAGSHTSLTAFLLLTTYHKRPSQGVFQKPQMSLTSFLGLYCTIAQNNTFIVLNSHNHNSRWIDFALTASSFIYSNDQKLETACLCKKKKKKKSQSHSVPSWLPHLQQDSFNQVDLWYKNTKLNEFS